MYSQSGWVHPHSCLIYSLHLRPPNTPIPIQNAIKIHKNPPASIDVISVRMQEQYKKQYGINSIVITRCISDDFPQNNKISKDKINILMGGYGNASMPWPNPLVETINQLNKKIDCQLFLFDPKLKQYENKYIKVSNLIDENSFNNLLETINIGYACDDLSPNKARFAQLSLPTKIITYIGAGIPFIYHGPLDSTVNDLIKTIEVGIVVSTNNSHDLVIAFETLLLKYEFYHRNCLQAKEKLFSQHIVQKFFYENLLKNIQ